MFGIPERHIDQMIENDAIPDAMLSLIEECGELVTALAKHSASRYDSYADSIDHICEEMTHVLISMNLVARTFNISMANIKREIMIKAIADDFDTSDYIF